MSTMLAKLRRTTLALGGRCPGYLPVLRRLRSRQVAVVMYHGVTASPLPAENWCQLDASAFARQVEYLARHYTLLPLSEVIDRLAQDRPLPRSPAVLTFDDGFRNVLTTALPVLERHQAPATVFLVTGLMGTRQPAWPDRLFHAIVGSRRERVALAGRGEWPLATPAQRTAAHRALASHLKALPEEQNQRSLAALLGELGATEVPADSPLATLDWEEVERLRHTGLIEVGSHTHTHPILSRCSPEQQRDELRLSRDVLREALARLGRLRQRVRRYRSLGRSLDKLHSPNLEKALTFLDDKLLPSTSNTVERGNRRHRKMQQAVYRVRKQESLQGRLALDLQRDQQADDRDATLASLHQTR